ncbi:Secreted protein [Bordetella tumbae]|uniref:hypothetical protein n=1 Tax=Bordetella tumbae TaxID=1649139 RepID=UPI0039F00D91
MTAVTIWVLMAFIPPSHNRPPVMVIERFASQADCESRLVIFQAHTVKFACLPSRQISTHPLIEPKQ